MLKICQTFVCTKSRFGEILLTIGPATIGAFSTVPYPMVPMTPIGLTSSPNFIIRRSVCLNSRSVHSLPHSLISSFILYQTLRIWRAWGLQLFNNLLKLIHFVRNRLLKSEAHLNDYSNYLYLRNLLEVIQLLALISCNSGIICILVKLKSYFQIFRERPPVVILCLFRRQVVQKQCVFQRSRGLGYGKFPRGQAPGATHLQPEYEFPSDKTG